MNDKKDKWFGFFKKLWIVFWEWENEIIYFIVSRVVVVWFL